MGLLASKSESPNQNSIPFFTDYKVEDRMNILQKAMAEVLKQGPIPEHVAFIMDGNRRFARERKLQPIDGHKFGSDKVSEVLNWCWKCGIKEITLYAFSIENYKRPGEEVEGLVLLFREFIAKALSELNHCTENGICFQFIGDWNLMPKELRPSMAELMLQTRNNNTLRINIAISYTGRNEITNGIQNLLNGVRDGDILLEDISEDILQESLQVKPSKPLDLLIRTSGETRLSDFMLWESVSSTMVFLEVRWPELNYWDLVKVIMEYQFQYKKAIKIKVPQVKNVVKSNKKENCMVEQRKRQFVKKLRKNQWKFFEAEASQLNHEAICEARNR